MKVSLGTREPREALRLAQFLAYVAPQLRKIRSSETMDTPHSVMREALKKHYSQLLIRRKAQMQQSGPLSQLDISILETSQAIAVEAVAGKTSLDMVSDDSATVNQMIAKYGLSIQPGTADHDMFRSELRKAYRDYCSSVLVFNQSLESYDFTSEGQPTQVAKPDTDSPTLQALIDRYIADELQAKSWKVRTEEQARQHIRLLIELIPSDTPINDITSKQALEVRDTIQRMPKNRHKDPKTRNLSLTEILNLDHANRLSIRSINDYLQTYSSLFSRGVKLQMIDRNPFDGMQLKETKKNVGRRDVFTDQQLIAIEQALLSTDSETKPKTSHKWASLIGIYTGARQGEIAQLTVQDVIDREGIPFLNIKEDEIEKQSLKTETSERTVPVHSRLVALGFLEYVDELRTDGKARLFPDYSHSPKSGWGRSLSRWFNDNLLVDLGIKEKALVFHSLRHTMNTKLHHADVLPPMVKAITGHKDDSMSTGTYFGTGYKPEQLKAAIDKFSFQPKQP